jgi:predicted Mrr-cat superfamily restriction endonuclease
MNNVYCVRADYGKYVNYFLRGGYAAIGWDIERDLSGLTTIEDVRAIYEETHPKEKPIVADQQIGQIARFLFDIKSGHYVITPTSDTEHIYYGVVEREPAYYYNQKPDGCPFPHRKRVRWNTKPINTGEFPDAFQNGIRSRMTVFAIPHKESFLETINRNTFKKEDLKM